MPFSDPKNTVLPRPRQMSLAVSRLGSESHCRLGTNQDPAGVACLKIWPLWSRLHRSLLEYLSSMSLRTRKLSTKSTQTSNTRDTIQSACNHESREIPSSMYEKQMGSQMLELKHHRRRTSARSMTYRFRISLMMKFSSRWLLPASAIRI